MLSSREILIVDDDVEWLDIMNELLGEHFSSINSASNALEAMTQLEDLGFNANALIDISLGIPMNGGELARALLKKRPDLNVVLMTGHDPSYAASRYGTEFPIINKDRVLNDVSGILDCAQKYHQQA